MKYWWGSFSLNRTRVAAKGKVMLMTTTIRRLQNQTPVAHMIASSSLLPLQSLLYNQHYLTLSIVTSLINIVITTGWPASATASSPFGSTLYMVTWMNADNFIMSAPTDASWPYLHTKQAYVRIVEYWIITGRKCRCICFNAGALKGS